MKERERATDKLGSNAQTFAWVNQKRLVFALLVGMSISLHRSPSSSKTEVVCRKSTSKVHMTAIWLDKVDFRSRQSTRAHHFRCLPAMHLKASGEDWHHSLWLDHHTLRFVPNVFQTCAMDVVTKHRRCQESHLTHKIKYATTTINDIVSMYLIHAPITDHD